ncbi:hypothetical protein BJY01DRAFT_239946 [Aspergillus pseudoustus]|uniref:Ribonuclease H1 N-terminal domain-containing protein n=1 Tax=Aspergillus pseudoustus TaxID=1810923 RepID=A0ABR4IVX2_9EURO
MSQSNYYVVYKGRVNDPTIFSSWAQVHPRVTGYRGAHHQGFDTLEDARSSLRERGYIEFSAVVQSNSTSTTSTRGQKKFYAVAYGRTSGIFEDYRDVEMATKGFKSACHQGFETRKEAERFINEWRTSYCEVFQKSLRDKLDNGWSPRDLSFKTEAILKMDNGGNAAEGLAMMMENLDFKR